MIKQEVIPLEAAMMAEAIVEDGKFVKIVLFAHQFELADRRNAVHDVSVESMEMVHQALMAYGHPPVELKTDGDELTEEQKAIAIKHAEGAMDNCDFDDLYEAAVHGSTDTPEKLRDWYKFAMEEKAEEDNDPRLRGEEL